MIVSSLVYIRQNGKTLMIKKDGTHQGFDDGIYNGIGGKLEKAESPELCAYREIAEETGLVANDLVLRGYITFPHFQNDIDWLVFIYECYDFSGEVTESDEGSLHWIDDDEILNLNIYEGDVEFLNILYGSDDFFYGECYYEDEKYDRATYKRVKSTR